MTTHRSLRFRASVTPIVGVIAFVSVVAALSVITHLRILGPDISGYPDHLSALLSLPFFVVIFLGTWRVLQSEGIPISAIGLGKSEFLSGIVAFGLVWGWSTVAGLGYLMATGANTAIGFAFDIRWYWVPIWFLLTLTLSNGLTEEFVFRGYVQSKCTALASGRSWLPAAGVGIVAGAILFGIPHIPLGLIAGGASPRAIPWIIAGNVIPGIAYGITYYLTQNLWYTGFVHGFGNATLVPFDVAAVPFFTPFATGSAVVIALGYRYWAIRTQAHTVRIHKRTATE